jgi:hypothetical protein
MPGPPPKKDAERRRRNKTPDNGGISAIPAEVVNLDDTIHREVTIPEADPGWEPLVKAYWESFAESGQSMYYEPSDWMTAYTLMEMLDRHLKPQDVKTGEYRPAVQDGGEVEYIYTAKRIPIPGSVMSTILKGLTALMATEGDRRRLRLELERQSAIEAAAEGQVIDIVKRREDAFKGA